MLVWLNLYSTLSASHFPARQDPCKVTQPRQSPDTGSEEPCFARCCQGVRRPEVRDISRLDCLACSTSCLRFVSDFAAMPARLGAGAARHTFTVRLLHLLHPASLLVRSASCSPKATWCLGLVSRGGRPRVLAPRRSLFPLVTSRFLDQRPDPIFKSWLQLRRR